MYTPRITTNQVADQLSTSISTFAELKAALPNTGKRRVLGIRQLQKAAKIILQAKVESGYLFVFSNGYCLYVEGENHTVLAVDRCSLLKWYSCTGEVLTSKGVDLGPLPWTMPLEIAGTNRIDHNRYNQQKRREKYSISSQGFMNQLSANTEQSVIENDESEFDSHQEQLRLLAEATKLLTEKQREVLLLSSLEKLTQNQLAARTGLSRATVREHLSKAKKKIEKYFEKNGQNTRHFAPSKEDK